LTIAARQLGLEEYLRVMKGTEEQPNLDAMICDWECAESILKGVQLFFWDVPVEIFNELIVTHQLHSTTTTEVTGVIHKDTARLHLS